MSYIRPSFTGSMEARIINNAHKGEWDDWKPSKEEAIAETLDHLNKLVRGLFENDPLAITEYSADVALHAMKIEELYGLRY